jgi:hypothetical protein
MAAGLFSDVRNSSRRIGLNRHGSAIFRCYVKGFSESLWTPSRAIDFYKSMAKRVLITGGAGFVGSHVADELVEAGYSVRVLDNLAPQVHDARARRPAL